MENTFAAKRQQENAELKKHGYTWVLRAPNGDIVSVVEAKKQIAQWEREQEERELDMPDRDDISLTWDGYFSEGVADVLGSGAMYQEGTCYISLPPETQFVPTPPSEDDGKKKKRSWGALEGRYTLPNGTVLIFDGSMLETAEEAEVPLKG